MQYASTYGLSSALLRIALVGVATFSLNEAGTAQVTQKGWWFHAGIAATDFSQFCDREAISWNCGVRGTSALGRFHAVFGRDLTQGLSVGLELSPQERHTTIDPANKSTLVSYSAAVIAAFYPMRHPRAFVQVVVGMSRFVLKETDNGYRFTESGFGWVVGWGAGVELHLAGPLSFVPFARLDFEELGRAKLFFERLQQRLFSVGLAIRIR